MNDQVFRIVAAVIAFGVFAYPFVWPAITSIVSRIKAPAAADPVRQKMQDIQTILTLSARFSAAGSKEGVDLCQKLIDVLLKPSK